MKLIFISGNPRVIIEKPLHSSCVTVWCAFLSGGVIGASFYGNEAGKAVTDTGMRYREMGDDVASHYCVWYHQFVGFMQLISAQTILLSSNSAYIEL